MKTNHRRSQVKDKGSFDYGYQNYQRRFKYGLGADHSGGHQGSAKDIRELKTCTRRKERRENTQSIKLLVQE